MANPQKENGYTAIANEIIEAFASMSIPNDVMRMVFVVLRKTYGFHKKEDLISLSQFCQITGMDRGNVCRALKRAKQLNILVGSVNTDTRGGKIIKHSSKYRLNKNFDTWGSVNTDASVYLDNKVVSTQTINQRLGRHIQKKLKEKQKKERGDALSEKNLSFFSQGEEYWNLVDVYAKTLPKMFVEDELKKFYVKWSEKNPKGKSKWELEPTFEIENRVFSWFQRAKEFISKNRAKKRRVL